MGSQDTRYWLFNVMYRPNEADRWRKMLRHGVAAQHYPPGLAGETRNVNALRQVQSGDKIVAAFGSYRFAGYATITSDFSRGGHSMEVQIAGGTRTIACAERFECEWAAIPPDRASPFVDCSDLKNRYSIGLLRGCCVKEIGEDAFNALKSRLDRHGAVTQRSREISPMDRRQENNKDTAQQFIGGFQELAQGMKGLIAQAEAEEIGSAPWYNVFLLLGVYTDEDKTHTPMLANLLNPKGSHGQGALFLEAFLAHCRTKPGFTAPQGHISASNWVVQTQRCTPLGIIDLVLIAPELRYMIAIENKLLAGEQERQLDRYYKWMRSLRDCYPHQTLVFLTPEGRNAASAKEAMYARVSYQPDIVEILRGCLPAVGAGRVRSLLEQYIDLIRYVFAPNSEGDFEMNTNADEEIATFLLQKGHLRIATQIRDKLSLAMNKAFGRFWNAVLEIVKTGLSKSALESVWNPEMLRNDYGIPEGVIVYDHGLGDESKLSYFVVNVCDSPPGIVQAVMLPEMKTPDLDKEFARLRTSLIDRGCARGVNNCLAVKQSIEYTTQADFEFAVGDRIEGMAEVVGRAFWDFFIATKTEVEALNARLKKSSSK